MNLTRKQIRVKTNSIGTPFFQSFPIKDGVAIGSRFVVEGQEWVVGRIDNVVAGYKELHVEGMAIPTNLESSQ